MSGFSTKDRKAELDKIAGLLGVIINRAVEMSCEKAKIQLNLVFHCSLKKIEAWDKDAKKRD